MAKSTKINVNKCPKCGGESEYSSWCSPCGIRREYVSRNKLRVNNSYKVVDWFSSRSSAGLTIEDAEGQRYSIYMSDVFRYLNGLDLGRLTLEETKKGSAYGWCVVNEEEAVN